MNAFRPEPLESCGIILTYQCTNRCRHCLYASSPRARKWMDLAYLERLAVQLRQLRRPVRSIHLAGGEPFIRFDLLVQAVQLLVRAGLPLHYVETNAFWATSDDVARQKLRTLKEAGLPAVLISVSPFHLENIPFERTARAIRIAREVFGSWGTLLFTDGFYRHLEALGVRGRLSFDDYQKLVHREWLARQISVDYQFVPGGRAVYMLAHLFERQPPQAFFGQSCAHHLAYPGHVHLDLYGNYIGGLCAGISVGRADDLAGLFQHGVDLGTRPVLERLVRGGVEALLQWAQEEHGYRPLDAGYIAPCHLCVDIRRHLYAKGFRPPELAPDEFYRYLQQPVKETA